MLNCKLIYKFILIVLIIIVMQTSTCNAGCASDGGVEIPVPEIPDTTSKLLIPKSMKSAEISPKKPDMPIKAPEVSEAKEKIPEIQESQKPEVKIQEPEKALKPEFKVKPSEKKNFLLSFFTMLDALVKTILLLLLTYAGILIYKHLKKRKMSGLPHYEEKIQEPRNVSEAVSSYVKHKLKKSA